LLDHLTVRDQYDIIANLAIISRMKAELYRDQPDSTRARGRDKRSTPKNLKIQPVPDLKIP